jgi:hypothetical protein
LLLIFRYSCIEKIYGTPQRTKGNLILELIL